ncbi:MAG TPA: tRNA (adenosine(37)-N6)-threonylcarbamoyltransferase complex ATPase subunit type 1 TsaE [Ruminiclostridium sp.]|nr:tRNA (adenosine(37)-N6)-threonylcarbamoyltransferase complex ATPase subunit type 1 TsaE [Ruminiclostridium sp.]
MRQIITHNTEETEKAGMEFAKSLSPGDVIAFFGGLGMGKTAFIRGIARGLDVTDHVSSPTFAIVHEYRGRIPLFHFDMYRITTWDDLETTGFFDYLDCGGVCAVEWSENIEEALPENTVRIEISKDAQDNDDNMRVITIKGMFSDEDTRG